MRSVYILLLFVISFARLNAQVVISEIMYNDPSPGDTLEFIELTNVGSSTVNLQNYSFGLGVTYTFPSVNLASGGIIVVAKDSIAMLKHFNITARQWTSGALNNNGEPITLKNGSNALVDSVRYDISAPWPQEANGAGYSANLCDLKSDNSSGSNWGITLNNSGTSINGINIYASPGTKSLCPSNPLVKFIGSSVTKNENDAGLIVKIAKNGVGSGVQKVFVNIGAGSTATNNTDFLFNTPYEVAFSSSLEKDTQTFIIPIIDDTNIEGDETLILTLSNPQNLDILPNFKDYNILIKDNDVVSNDAFVLTGIFDAQPGGVAGAKGIELYTLKDIPDLSIYGVGSANNGGGSDGIEFVFPAISVTKGNYIHIAADSALFASYFGFDADYISSAVNINGNDAIELFEGGAVVDVFGEIDVDGTGTPWEYLDGWAYRKNGTGPDGSTFVLDNWKFSGIDALEGFPTNADATNPFPINTYNTGKDTVTICINDVAQTDFNSAIVINVLANDILPNGVKTLTAGTPLHGTTSVSNNKVIYTPDNGYCGPDAFNYTVTDNKFETSFATVNVTVLCASSYPVYTIAKVTTNNGLGVADSLDVYCQLQGVIYGNDFQGNNNIQFYMIDNTGGISVFGNEDFGYTVKEGDEVIVRGKIDQFAGLTQITPDTLWKVSGNNTLKSPTVVTKLDESTESEFIKIMNLHFKDKAQWTTGVGTGFNVDLLDDLGATISMRIDNDVPLFNQPAPSFNNLHVTGLGSQFDNTQPFTEGYQILPRYISDLEGYVSTFDPGLKESVFVYPNLFSDFIVLSSTVSEVKYKVYDLMGSILMQGETTADHTKLDLGKFEKGIYFIKLESNDRFWTQKLIKH